MYSFVSMCHCMKKISTLGIVIYVSKIKYSPKNQDIFDKGHDRLLSFIMSRINFNIFKGHHGH